MKNARFDELRLLSKLLSTKGSETHPRFGAIIARYRSLALDTKTECALNDAVVEEGQLLFSEGKYAQAILVHETHLAARPGDLMANYNLRSLLSAVGKRLAHLAEIEPETAEYGRTYEKLRDLGSVALVHHLGAVRHYLAGGQIQRAAQILVDLARVAPSAIGVSRMIEELACVTDDARIQSLKLRRNQE